MEFVKGPEPCQHIVCIRCALVHKRCPYCRTPFQEPLNKVFVMMKATTRCPAGQDEIILNEEDDQIQADADLAQALAEDEGGGNDLI